MMQTHVKVLAVLFIVLSALGVLLACFLLFLFGGVAGLVGTSGDADAAVAVPIIGLTGMALVIFTLALSLPGLITGFGLLNFKPWARILGIVLCAINLINIPFGTVMGAYGLWVLLNSETGRLFSAAPVVQ